MSQNETVVVNLRKSTYDIYIGRKRGQDYHYGNPFTHHKNSCAQVLVGSREESVLAFKRWLSGEYMADIEPSRRAWILKNLKALKGKRLGCYCYPLSCHGDILAGLADATD